jgi:tRNA A-37 threonylcarbamoyl transferase component Bud32
MNKQYLQYQSYLKNLRNLRNNNLTIPGKQNQLQKTNNNLYNEKDLDNFALINQKRNEVMTRLKEFKNNNLILNYLNKLPDIYNFNSEHTLSDKVTLIEGFIVKKVCHHNSFGNYLFWNEVKALHKLRGYPHFPHLYAYDSNNLIIYMSYCGKLISSDNLPTNWKQQIEEISIILKTLNVNSNDMLLRNICCLNGEIKIIDFGLHTIFGKTIETVSNELYSNLNSLSKPNNITNNQNTDYNYIKEYPNWRDNLEKYKIYEEKMKQIKEMLVNKKKERINSKKI